VAVSDLVIDTVDVVLNVLREHKGDVSALPKEMQVVLRVHSAQGVMDNGGLQFFFESNWEGTPPYSVFVEAFREIGAYEAADRLEEAVAMFSFENPHLHADKRCARMSKLWEDPSGRFGQLDSESCGDDSVWQSLKKYIKRYSAVFKAR
jgi:hypothetical protein